MKKKFIILFTIILLCSTLIYSSAGKDNQITAGEIIKEMNLLKNKLSSMDIYTEPSGEGSLQIERDYRDGKEVIVRIIFDIKGNVRSFDKYFFVQDKLIWEHEEGLTVHFIITVEKNGTLKRKDLSFPPVPTCTPVRKATYTPVPQVSCVTPTQQVKPAITPVHVSPTVFPTQSVKFKEKIIFVSDLDGTMNIYTINPDGTNLHKITKEKYKKAFPSISPDGMNIIYSGNKDGKWSIYIINLDGTMEKRITNSGSNDIMPCFIDKNNIIFQSFREGKPGIYRMSLDTKKVSLLTSGFTLAIHPVLYPDRKKIIFAGEKEGETELYSIDIDGKNLKALTHSGFEKSFPSISPDGKKIAFSGNDYGRWSIYIIDLARGGQKKINTGFKDSTYPSWTSDGTYIIFQALEKGKIGLFKINSSGSGEVIKLTDNKSDYLQARFQLIMLQ